MLQLLSPVLGLDGIQFYKNSCVKSKLWLYWLVIPATSHKTTDEHPRLSHLVFYQVEKYFREKLYRL
jgi:hypothetical protein